METSAGIGASAGAGAGGSGAVTAAGVVADAGAEMYEGAVAGVLLLGGAVGSRPSSTLVEAESVQPAMSPSISANATCFLDQSTAAASVCVATGKQEEKEEDEDKEEDEEEK